MSLSDLIADEHKNPGTICTLATIISKLDPADTVALAKALADSTVSAPQLCRALVRAGHPITRGVVERHRRGDCACNVRGAASAAR